MAVTINGTTGITDVDGSAAAPAITGTDTDTGLFFSANTLGMSVGGAAGATLTTTGLGIGTSSPDQKLAVAGRISISGSGYTVNSTNGLVGAYSGNMYLQMPLSGNLQIWKSTTDAVAVFDQSGNLGLGVTPSGSSTKQFEIGYAGQGLSSRSGIMNYVLNGTYNSGWKYAGTGAVSNFELYNGTFAWYTAPSGAAGNAISFTQAMTLNASGVLLVGATSSVGSYPKAEFHNSGSTCEIGVYGNNYGGVIAKDQYSGKGTACYYGFAQSANIGYGQIGTTSNHDFVFITNGTERARIDSSGNISYGSSGSYWGLVVQDFSTQMSLGTGDVGLCFVANSGQKRVIPRKPNSIGAASDNLIDLGDSGSRFRVIYAGTGTINTSDENEKQDIKSLSDAEKRVAVKIKSLIKTFRFKDAVAEKGDAARIHTGVIAQEVRNAFTSEGLDAHRYALFCSDTWYTVNDMNAKPNGDLYTVDDEGAIEHTRLGIRYDELLSFVIAAI